MDSNRLLVITSAAAVMALAMPAAAQQATAEMHAVSAEGIGEQVGTIQLADSAEGLVIQTDLSGLPPGPHGLHLHSEGSCEPAQNDQGQMAAAMAAKGHYDPDNTEKHAGPEEMATRAISLCSRWRPTAPRKRRSRHLASKWRMPRGARS